MLATLALTDDAFGSEELLASRLILMFVAVFDKKNTTADVDH